VYLWVGEEGGEEGGEERGERGGRGGPGVGGARGRGIECILYGFT
jgi:hypothetical protein